MKRLALQTLDRLRELAPRTVQAVRRKHRVAAPRSEDEIQPVPPSFSSAMASLIIAPSSMAPLIYANGSHNSRLEPQRGPRPRGLTKDALLFTLDALAQSADAFPPLKSAVGGLLFVANQIECFSGNKAQVIEVYAHIDALAASLMHAIPAGTTLSPALRAAIRTLANEVMVVRANMEAIAQQHWAVRFLRAKRNDKLLQELTQRLNRVNDSFVRTMVASSDVKITQILATVQQCTVLRTASENKRKPSPVKQLRVPILFFLIPLIPDWELPLRVIPDWEL